MSDPIKKSKKDLTLVVGAGASYEAGLPLGSELKDEIASLLNLEYDIKLTKGDYLIDKAFGLLVKRPQGEPGDSNNLIRAARRISQAMPQAISIDNFIDAHRGDKNIETAGKLAIVRSILMAEAKSKLKLSTGFQRNDFDFKALTDTWFNSFFQILTENCTFNDLPDRFSKVGVISFNYDRCIEHFLFHSLQNYYGVESEAAADALSHLEIYHPYGSVGKLPFMGRTNTEESIQFGGTPTAEQLVSLSSRIMTFTEGSKINSSEIENIHDTLNNAKYVTFLGFAFHKLNLKLLYPQKIPFANDRSSVFATGKGVSDSDCRIISFELSTLAGFNRDRITISQLTCFDFFNEYRRSISFR